MEANRPDEMKCGGRGSKERAGSKEVNAKEASLENAVVKEGEIEGEKGGQGAQ